MQLRRYLHVVVLIGVGLAALSAVSAAPAAEQEGLGASNSSSSNVAKWVAQLDDPQFAVRRVASQRLSGVGVGAVAALEQVAMRGNRESARRALEILTQYVEHGETSSHIAARAALQNVAAARRGAASRSAEESLGQLEVAQNQWQPRRRIGFQGPLQPLPALDVPRPVMFHVRVRVAAGSRTVEIRETDQFVCFRLDANGGVRVEVEQRNRGELTRHSYEADSLDALRKNHPDGYRWYERHTRRLRQMNAGRDAQ